MATSKPAQDIADWGSTGDIATSIPPAEVEQGQQAGVDVPAAWINLFGAWIDFLRAGGGQVFVAPSGLSWGDSALDVTLSGLDADVQNNTGTGNFSVDAVSSPINAPGTAESITIDFGSVTSVSSGVTVQPFIYWYDGGSIQVANFGAATPSSGASTLTVNFSTGVANIAGPWTLRLDVSVDDGDRVDIRDVYVTLS